ncbi:MAG TPA: bifunctional homocysteine S-methyltransferase/methylenetetrahydrofolate reductase [Anaerolineaceae bacterium]|nr:bifunctional homocysteine S-methyltransferase/methylenetetrahydrofolate reductase [Anaerolineaceae bacterium]HOU42699.1 bifunctional homocysteine S-methyltransferase/methylenetetrahydrofolate reductase [Anaerolineaceae bacterium]HQF45271.1 bifunctional homocysteine S-methyltransferase/methylenetetrahydrofolate reductase [Anaerolineaceae bacterium]HQH35001.1 bifunctional homocysteine S-methyltransferase/methylenetetrahydrofolate reductase [Anaerolineaceae bacterium]HQJ02432.1 bifunctional hom
MSNPGKFHEIISSGERPLISDGAMGTLLNQRGISFEQSFDSLNLSNPALVAQIHREYIDAGATMIQTNTFSANRYKLAQHGQEHLIRDINTSAVELARRVVLASFKDVLIAGDVGPLGVRLAPFGRVQPEQARQAFAEQIEALSEAGVDLLIIETMTDLFEVDEAIRAAREIDPSLGIIASMTFTRDDRTLLGDSPAKVARHLAESGADVIGVNCSGGPSQILHILREMHLAVPSARLSAMPNAGWPQQVGGRIMYPAGADYFSEYALAFWQTGAVVIGGCCGTTPLHITAMRKAIDSVPERPANGQEPLSVVERDDQALEAHQPTQFAQKLADGQFVFAVEMDPPRGLSTHKLLAGASLLSEAGADVIDVADSPMARMRMSPWAVCSLIQRKVGIETTLHFPTRGRNLLRVQGDLLAAHALGVRNVFVVMGDPTAIGDYPDAMDNYDLVPSGLIKLIKQGFNAGVDHAGMDIGQPTSFFVGCALNLNPNRIEDEIRNLRRKLDAGADFVLTQPTYSPSDALRNLDAITKAMAGSPVPILVGILPLASARHAAYLHHEVPGILVPDEIRRRMESAGEGGARTGMEIAIELIRTLRPAIQGVYLMPAFSRYDIAAEIIETIKSE